MTQIDSPTLVSSQLDAGTRTRNALLRDLRRRGERGFALLTQR